ncbi:MAG: FHA domain-containing protein [Myxococcota bacterium]
MLREALGLEPLGQPSPSDATQSGSWGVVTDGDDDDEEGEDEGPLDDTTVLMPIPDKPTSEADVPTLIESAVRRADDRQPKSTGGVFGFPAEVQDDDVDKLSAPATPLARGVTSKVPEADRRDAPRPSVPPEVTQEIKGLPASLEFMSGPDRGKRVVVGQELRVGQSRQCELSIPSDGRLSAIHCRVARTPEGFLLTDEGSANGTVVNGQRVTRFSLHGGEVIMVGRTVLRFWLEGAS